MKFFIIIFFSATFSSCLFEKKEVHKVDKTTEVLDTVKPLFVKDSMQILTVENMSLLKDSILIEVSPKQVSIFFNNGEILKEEAVNILGENHSIVSIQGEMILNNDTLVYFIHSSGIGFYAKKADKVTYVRNLSIIPSNTYKKVKSKINILSYRKNKFDFSLWEEWKEWNKNDPDNTYVDNNKQYKAYKRWNDKLYVNEICRAFNQSMYKS